MTTPAKTMTTEEARATLINHVSVPAFFEKLAAETGTTPSSEQEARTLLNMGDLVKAAVDLYIQREYEMSRQANSTTVKAAVDAAFEVAGIGVPTTQTQTPSVDFLRDEAVKLAAETLFAAAKQAAGEAPAAVTPAQDASAETTTEEDENKPVA